jgi:alpha/beta superfamily hydrolase
MIDVLIQIAQKINSPLEIIYGADHFYMGKEKELALIISKCIIKPNNKITKNILKKA